MEFKWRVNRLLSMSLSEILFRSYRLFAAKALKINLGHNIKVHIDACDVPFGHKWYFDDQDLAILKAQYHSSFGLDEMSWESILEHKINFFALDTKYAGERINWYKDYKLDVDIREGSSKPSDYRLLPGGADIKYIWELNRHQYLVDLAKGYFLTGRAEYKSEIIKQINSWIADNPYGEGVNWESSLESAIRLISWSWIWHFLGEIEGSIRSVWIGSIFQHCRHINANYSKYSSANNHLIGEAAGLFIASIVWPFKNYSAMWRGKAYQILLKEIREQQYKDGVNKEQAIWYQHFVLDFFLLAGILGEKNGIIFPAAYWEKIEQMMTFIANVMDKNGNVPNVGDADDGYGFKISSYFSEPFTAHLSIGSVLFKRGDFKLKIRKYDEKSFWLLGKDSIDSFHKINIEKGTGIKQYPSGGYYILSMKEETENEIKLVFDCGEQGYLSIAAHGHADALSFTLSVGGSLFLIDPGTFAYHTNKEWREYFRNSSAHNTVVIDGRSQAITGGAFLWSRKVKASFISCAFSDDKDCVAAEHDGYLFLKDPVRHIREICLDKIQRRIKVIDTLKCRKRHKIEQYFHFASECRVEKKYANEFVVDNNGGRIAIWTDTKFLSVVMKGEDQPIIGWESKKYDTKLPSSTLINSGWVDGDIVLTTEIQC